MNDDELLECIAHDPDVMTGKPVIRGTRLMVDHILNLVAHGVSEDIRACLLFSAKSLSDSSFMPLKTA